jgi:uncharacterized protein YcfJ
MKLELRSMSRLVISALNLGLGAALAFGLSACNRSADANADAGADPAASGAPVASAAPAAPPVPAVQYGRVVSVDPVRQTVAPVQECHDEAVTRRAPVKDQHQIAGTAIGAVLGGVLGHQVGGGKGNTLATVAGAVGGGYAGHEIQENRQEHNTTTTVQRRCKTVTPANPDQIVAYDVRYEFNGVTRTVRMDHDPGDRVEVQQGIATVSDAR